MSAFQSVRGALAYSLHRPKYPDKLIDLACSNLSSYERALDVACGSGQLTNALSSRFGKVIGIDRSKAQLEKALKGSNVEYKCGTAENFFVPEKSCDLITVAQALHWFDLKPFFNEVNRALKPKGRLAVFGYGMCSIEDPDLDAEVKNYYFDTLGSSKEPGDPGCFWQISRPLLDSGLKSIDFPYKNVRRSWETTTEPTTLSDFIGYLSSFSAYEKLLEKQKDPLPDLKYSLEEKGWKGKVNVIRPFFLIVAENQFK